MIFCLNRFMDFIEFRNNKSQELIEFQNLDLKGISFKEFGHPFRPTLVTQTYRWLKNPTGNLAFIQQNNN